MKSNPFLRIWSPVASLLLLPHTSRAQITPPIFHFPAAEAEKEQDDVFYHSDVVNATFTTPYRLNMITMWCNDPAGGTRTGKPAGGEVNNIRNEREPDKPPTWVAIPMDDVILPAKDCWFLLQEYPRNSNPGVNSGRFFVLDTKRTVSTVQPPGSTSSSSASSTGTSTSTSTSSATRAFTSPSELAWGPREGSSGQTEGGSKGLSGGIIAGIVVAVVVVVLGVGVSLFRWRRRKEGDSAWFRGHRKVEKAGADDAKPAELPPNYEPAELSGYRPPEVSGGQVTVRYQLE